MSSSSRTLTPRLTDHQARRLWEMAETEPKKTFRSSAATVRFLKKDMRKKELTLSFRELFRRAVRFPTGARPSGLATPPDRTHWTRVLISPIADSVAPGRRKPLASSNPP